MKAYQLILGLAAASVLAACTTTTTKAPTTVAAPAVSDSKAVVMTSENVDAQVVAYVVRTANGQETLEPISTKTAIKSGDVVEYHGLFTNTGKERVRNMTVTLNLPQGAVFTGQADPALGTLASLDHSQFLRMPIRQSVNGQAQNVPFAQYRALRWTIEELGIGGTAVVKYRATIR